MNEIGNRLCLAQIHFSVKECPFRKLSWLRVATSILNKGIDDSPGHIEPSVAAHLNGVFACVGIRSLVNKSNNVIEVRAVGRYKSSEMSRFGFRLGQVNVSNKPLGHNGVRFRPAHPDN